MKQVGLPVNSVEEVMPGTFVMWLTAPDFAAAALPGQFLMVRCGNDTILRRPLSVHAVDGDRLALLFTVRGKGTRWLAEREAGHEIDAFGMMGKGFRIAAGAKNLLLVSGGTGIAPLYCLAERESRTGRHVTLLMGAASVRQLYPLGRLPQGVEAVLATEDGSSGHKGLVTELIPEHAGAADQVIAVGPLPMYRHMAANRTALGIAGKGVQISLEMRMGCGLGVCYGCTVRTKAGLKQTCKEGPVFDLDEVIWDDFTRC